MSLHLSYNVKEPTKTPAQLPYPFFSGRSARQIFRDCLGDRVGHRCGDTHLGKGLDAVNTKIALFWQRTKKVAQRPPWAVPGGVTDPTLPQRYNGGSVAP